MGTSDGGDEISNSQLHTFFPEEKEKFQEEKSFEIEIFVD
jgi:hypothetical protein